MPDIITGGATNVTQSAVTMNTAGFAPLIFIGILIVAVVGFAIIISSLERFTRFMNLVERAVHSIRYTIYGAGLSAVGLFLYTIFNILRTATRGFDPIWYGYAIIIYGSLTAVGWFAEKVYARTKRMHSEYRKGKDNKPGEVQSEGS